jgi:tRNA dimethylallyltransferase
MTRPVFILTGPTASGKSSLAIGLARIFPFEIVNADSLQFFRGLDIGSAKPSREELGSVPHHLIDVLEADGEATAAWFAVEGARAIESIAVRGRIPLVVGGAGFYLRALERPPLAPPTRFESEAPADDYRYLEAHDPEAARKIHPNDRYRVARAVSLLRRGERPSERWAAAGACPPRFDTRWLAPAWERAELYARIDRRLDEMFARGLLAETEGILRRTPGALPRLTRSIGYRQALAILRENASPTAAIAEAKTRSRQYAKRQMTWLRRESRIAWISGTNPFLEAKTFIERSLPA